MPPAQLALATLLQAYTGVSDDEVIEATTMDRRWQLVLDCLDCDTPPFRKGTLVSLSPPADRPGAGSASAGAHVGRGCRQRGLWRPPVAGRAGQSPLWGAGRVEDTYNLLGHALRKALGVMARQQGRGLRALAEEAGQLWSPDEHQSRPGSGLGRPWRPSAGADHDPGQPHCRGAGARHPPVQEATTSRAVASLAVAKQVCAQDLTTAPDGTPTLRQGVAEDRRMSVEEAEMRHGRKSRSLLIDGYKRHVRRDVDSGLMVAVGVTPANVPEASVTDAIATDVAAQQSTLQERHIDRAYLASPLVQQRPDTLTIFCKAWPVHQGPYVSKNAVQLAWERHTLQCPGGERMPFVPGEVVKFPAATCARCALREHCTTSASGRSVTIHPDEALLQELRERQQTPQGRAKLRERVAVEHALAHWALARPTRSLSGGAQKCV